ncbi:MAG TPA: (d)CMP kinase [Anaerolineaceae bacterium]
MVDESKRLKPKVIAIDGPAGSGKTTLASLLAKTLDYLYLDTGEMYRALTWAALRDQVDINDGGAVTRLAQRVEIDVHPSKIADGRVNDVLLNGQDVTWEIRRPEVESNVSIVAAYPDVRHEMTVKQRQIGLRGNVVMAGRDIGTVVFPDAELKIYLDASAEERARRRFSENQARGFTLPYDEILASMRRRDEIDSTREVAPLRPAEDAVLVDSDELSVDEVLKKVLFLLGKINR